MAIASSNILRVVARMQMASNDIENVYHLRLTVSSDPGDSTTVDEIADWLDAAYAQIDQIMPDDVSFSDISVWNVSTDTFLGQQDWPLLVAGTVSANAPLPPQTAALVLFNTNVNRSQGRKFLPPFTSLNLGSDGTPDSTATTAMGNWAAEILGGVTGTGWSGEPGNWNATLARFVPWQTALVRDVFATQRRRYIGSGS